MRTDREALQLAARAIGLMVEWSDSWGCFQRDARPVSPGYSEWLLWRPLSDDGDALRLASALELDIMYRVVGGNRVEVLPPGGPLMVVRYIDDRLAATRRAIVDAAAEVGAKLAKRARAQVAEPAHNEIGGA